MSTIPASLDVNVIPNVVGASGTALAMLGMTLDDSARVPIGTVQSFATAAAVGTYFGSGSKQKSFADVYFNGYTGRTAVPSALRFTQYPKSAVAAYLRGGNISGQTIAQLQALSGSLTAVVDGYTHVISSISLASYGSQSLMAAAIAAAFTDPTEASFTASLGAAFTASAGSPDTKLVVTAVTGLLSVGDVVTGVGIPVGTTILSQDTGGTPGGAGTYVLSASNTASAASCTCASTVLDVTVDTDATIAVGQTVVGSGVTGTPIITAQLTGSAGTVGTYRISGAAQHIASEAMTATATAPLVTYDSTAGAFVITSGITGTPSTAAFATGTLAAPLLLTSTTGAVLSQGAAAAVPATFMDALVALTQNWVSFTTDFDPDGGSGNTVKLAFAAWCNSIPDRYLYAMWDTDITPTESTAATGSAGYIVNNLAYEGIAPIYEATDLNHAAFLMGTIASINFAATNGRITTKFKTQAGLVPSVTDETVAVNLDANGYNCVGAVATAADEFIYFRNGKVSGKFLWIDSYINQIWLNDNFQLTLIELLLAVGSIPYNPSGYALIEGACTGGSAQPIQLPPASPVAEALNFGAIRPNVPLSASQAEEVNNAAGLKIDGILSTRGWYFQIIGPTAQVRANRGTPICNFWYMDGQSVHQITLNSVEVA